MPPRCCALCCEPAWSVDLRGGECVRCLSLLIVLETTARGMARECARRSAPADGCSDEECAAEADGRLVTAVVALRGRGRGRLP